MGHRGTDRHGSQPPGGLCHDHCRLLPAISGFLRSIGPGCDPIVIDPLYKMLHEEYVSDLVDIIDRFGEWHGAATVYGAHLLKGMHP